MAITQSGTSITFNDATVQTTAYTGGGGTVTSVATGNGLSGGTITTSGTLVIACPTFNTVGSYCMVSTGNSNILSSGSNYAAGSSGIVSNYGQPVNVICGNPPAYGISTTNNLSGTWKWMAGPTNGTFYQAGLGCRVA